jgi:hypothetical protein
VQAESHASTESFSEALEPIYDLNRRMLALLSQPSAHRAEHLGFHNKTPVGLVLRNTECSDRERLAQCPFLLLNAAFRDPGKWQLAQRNSPVIRAALPDAHGVLALSSGTCLLAWYLVRTDSVAASLVLGASKECAALIARSSLSELQDTAARFALNGWITPRWHDRPSVWERLIRLAGPTTHASAGIHGLQLFLGELLDEDADS